MTTAAAAVVDRVRSVDGTEIGFRTSGTGPPLVMVHGGSADSTVLSLLVPLLEPHYTVHAMDRRGRGLSGDGRSYDVELEYADVAAVVDTVAQRAGRPVSLYGHSYGALCALGAARRTCLERLFLYEPAFHGVVTTSGGVLDTFEDLVDGGRLDDALEHFYLQLVGMSPGEVDAMRAAPSWTARLAAVRPLARELRVADAESVNSAHLAEVRVPTWCLVGDRSTPGQRNVVRAVNAGLPDGRVVVLPGQAHAAQVTAPHLVAEALVAPLLR